MFVYILVALLWAIPSPDQNNDHSVKTGIDLPTALHLVETSNPEFVAAKEALQSAALKQRLISLWPNPELEFESENFGSSDSFSGWDSAETVFAIHQNLPIWGTRQARSQKAAMETDSATLALAETRNNLRGQTALNFVDALASSRKLQIRQKMYSAFDQLLKAMQKMEQAGKIAPLDLRRAKLEFNSFQLSLETSKREKSIALVELFSLWSKQSPDSVEVSGSLGNISGIPPYDQYLQALKRSPQWLNLIMMSDLSQQDIYIARKERYPELNTTFGIKHHHELGETTFIFGVGIELPVFDSGSISESLATVDYRRTSAEISSAQQKLIAEVSIAHKQLVSALKIVRAFQSSINKEADQILADVIKGYQAGKFDLIDVLDMQRTVLTSQEDYISALANYHRIHIRLATLVGFPDKNHFPDPATLINGEDNEK